MKHPTHVPACVSVFVTVTSLAPVGAAAEMVMFAVTSVEDTKVVEFTVIPVPENDATAPVAKCVPDSVMSRPVAPWPRLEGEAPITVGSEPDTMKHSHDPVAPSGFETRTDHNPGAAFARANVAVIDDDELNTTFVPGISVWPVRRSRTVAPLWKAEPLMVTFAFPVFAAVVGVVEVGAGAALTVKHPVHDPDLPSVFVTVTLRAPVAAATSTETLVDSDVAETNVVELTVIPVPLNETVAPCAKLVPVTVSVWLVAP